MTREEHYRAALERIADVDQYDTGRLLRSHLIAAEALAAGGALPAEDTEAIYWAHTTAEIAEARLERIAELLAPICIAVSAPPAAREALRIARGEAPS